MTSDTLTTRIIPPLPRRWRGRYLLERNAMATKSFWPVLLSGAFEPIFFLFAIGVGIGELVGDITIGERGRLSVAVGWPGIMGQPGLEHEPAQLLPLVRSHERTVPPEQGPGFGLFQSERLHHEPAEDLPLEKTHPYSHSHKRVGLPHTRNLTLQGHVILSRHARLRVRRHRHESPAPLHFHITYLRAEKVGPKFNSPRGLKRGARTIVPFFETGVTRPPDTPQLLDIPFFPAISSPNPDCSRDL